MSAAFCSFSYFSPKPLLNRKYSSHKNDEDGKKKMRLQGKIQKTRSLFCLDQDLTPRDASRGTICCKRTVTFQRPPGEPWEQRDGLVGETFLCAARGIDAIYNDSRCPQLGMKTISICAGPRGDCRAGDVSAQCPLLERERGRVGREELGR